MTTIAHKLSGISWAEVAHNDVVRAATERWFLETFGSRVDDPNAAPVIVTGRIHSKDSQ